MTGPALQLFPPPPRAQRQASPNRKLRVNPPTPEPAAEGMDSSKSARTPNDFHELIIHVNSVPVSPSSTIVPPSSISSPPRAHIAHPQRTRTPPQEYRPYFESPPHARQPSPTPLGTTLSRAQDPRAPSPAFSVQDHQDWSRQQMSSPDQYRAMSPAFSTSATLVRANSTATHVPARSPQEELPMRSMFPVYDPTVALTHQQYMPTQASPTHIPRTQISRSPYSPTHYVPYSNIDENANKSPPPKLFFTPSHLLDNLWVSCNGQEEPTVQMYTLRMHRATAANPTITFGTTPSLPFYSLAQSNLAGDNEVESIMNEILIQRHHPTQPRVLPIAQMDLIAPPSLEQQAFNPQHQEPTTILTSIYPKLAALAALDAAANSPAASHIALMDPAATSPAAQRLAEDVLMGAAQRECCALAWTRDSPNTQTNPWARHMPSEGSYELHHPTLGTFPIKVEGDCSVINKPSTRPMTAMYGHNMPSTPPVPGQKPASITLLNPFVLSPTSPRSNAFSGLPSPPPFRFGGDSNRPYSTTPSEMDVAQLPTATDAAADDAILARLDFASDSLTLNLGALTHFGNPFLADVVVSTILAVAIAEAIRGRRTRKGASPHDSFEPPPPSASLNRKGSDVSDAQAFKQSFTEGFNAFGIGGGGATAKSIKKGGSSLKKWSSMKGSMSSSGSTSMDKDIELGEWYGQGKTKESKSKKKGKGKKGEGEVEEDKLPFVTRGIISVLSFAFRSVVFVLRITIKIVAGVIVMITRNLGRL